MKRERKVLVLLSVWLVANFIPHLVVFLATGKIYYQLPAVWMIVAESSIMLLNLLLPIFALRYIFKQTSNILSSLGWQWNGWRTVWIGLFGFFVSLVITIGTQQLIGNPISTSGQGFTGLGELAMAMVLLLVLTAAAEETMFRGLIQTTLTQDYGVWVGIGVTALLFGLRHLPMDLYGGFSQQAPPSAWISRMLQLYIGAVVFGIVRYWAKSTWASWIVHEGFLLLIVLLGIVAMQGQ
jgi:membrane protease YdiL (CAAX protease family)